MESEKSSKKLKYLQFLGSKKFLLILQQYDLEPLKYNSFFALHLLTVASQSNGIKEGHIKIEYVFSTESHFTKDVMGPKLIFGFYTNTYALIENTNRSTRSSAPIRNLNDYSFVDFKNAYTFRKFLLNQELQMKHLPGYTWNDISADKLNITYEKPIKSERENYFYEIIIEKNPELSHFLDFHFMNLEYHKENQENVSLIKKIKI